MIKKFVFSLLLLALVLPVAAQTIDQFQVPGIGESGGVKCPSIATNSRGDLMVVYRAQRQSIMYYFIKKSTGAVTQVKLPGSLYKDIIITSVVATADDNFHACWGEVYNTAGIGVYTADFNTTTETWSAPERIYTKYPEDSHLRVNPVNDDFALTVVLRQPNSAKDIYVIFRKSGQTAWGNEINLSTMPAAKSATNPYAHFDEAGYLHVVWKEDIGDDNLNIRVALIKKDSAGVYSMVDKKWATSNPGWQFLPSIAMTGTKGIITFCWSQQGAYYYLPYERSGDTVVVDPSKIVKLVSAPMVPWYTFPSKAVAHGDEIMFTYFDLGHRLQLLRYKDGVWLDTTPITLGNMEINKAPYHLWADPNLGLWATWFVETIGGAENGNGTAYYCLYNYPKPSIRPPVNITFLRTMERSFFHGYWMFLIKWADNPYNIEKQIKVVKFNIYRRIHWSSDKWLLVGSVDGTVFTFGDKNGVEATSDFEYAVTAVNEKNIESRIQENGSVLATREPIIKSTHSK